MEKKILEDIVKTSNYLYKKGLVPGKSGNISIRFIKDNMDVVAVTASGSSFKSVIDEDVVVVDMDGKPISDTSKRPTSELDMHLNIYKNRDDIRAIVHTHSPITTGFAFSGKKLERLEGFGPIEERYIPSVEYHPPGSSELAEAVSYEVKNQDVVLLKNHGVVTLGKNLDEATLLAEFIEESAKIQLVKKILSGE